MHGQSLDDLVFSQLFYARARETFYEGKPKISR